MTEKQYGGQSPHEKQGKVLKEKVKADINLSKTKKVQKEVSSEKNPNEGKILKAGKIASEVREYAKSIIKKEMPLLEIAEKIENKIIELGGKPAFPTNLSINEIAAHYTPSYDDKTLATGLLKIDFGVHIDGQLADTAFSLDLENSDENKKLIEAAETALENAIKISKPETTLSQIGKIIQETIESRGFSPIINLSGHSMEEYELHSGITIPNINNNQETPLEQGLFAIEPFATTGNGRVNDSKPSGIYMLINEKNIRSQLSREILEFIEENYSTLPFCSRWLIKKFGTKALFALKQLEDNDNLHQFPQLVESSRNKVSQAEHTLLITKDNVIVTTR
jgi:methionyl aminopeptidase